MQRTWRFTIGILSLGVLLGGSPSWGGPPNPTPSDANQNTAGGQGALRNNTVGTENTAFGFDALGKNTTGESNTASGFFALQGNTTGHSNTASGRSALQGNTTGHSNTASGRGALQNNAEGHSNTASGRGALRHNTTGDFNIAIGVEAGANLDSGDHNIYLGHKGKASDESRTMRLGQQQTRTFIAGITGVPVSGSAVFIDAAGQVGIQASAARYKADIQPLGTHSQGLFELRPVTFRYTQDPQGERRYGLIAEEVATIYPELVTRDAQGVVESVRYQEVIPLLLNALQQQLAALVARLAQVEVAVAQATLLAPR
jgi:Chaperone of endosialidase